MPERHLGRSLGRYRVDSLLGSGGFAWVYRGFDPDLEVPVAIKVLKPQFAGDPEFEERFRREASTAARLRHPNIVTIFAVGRDDGAVYFAMDYLPQGLTQRLELNNTLPEPTLLRLGIEVSRALAFAHRAGVIHRDIKVDNILFDDHGNAIVVDFGIARAASDAARETKTNVVVGTPQYFAPEQARGRAVDGRTDIYALGVTLFRAATGQLPFEGEDWYDIARKHVELAPPRPRSLNRELSAGFEAAILKCLEKRPEDRYQTADELGTALSELAGTTADAASEPTLTVPAIQHTGERILEKLKRRRLVMAASIGGAVLAIAILMSLLDGDSTTEAVLPAQPQVAELAPLVVPAPQDTSADSVVMVNGPQVVTTATLRVIAPGAQILLDSRSVGSNEFRRSGLAPGAYTVSARVASIPNCRWAEETERVTLTRAETTTVQLSPRQCGRISFPRIPAGTTYRLSGPDGVLLTADVPLDAPVVVPAGNYTLTLSRPGCESYGPEQLEVPPATAQRPEIIEWATLRCGNGKPEGDG
ncbi:MAG TPA: serine/threonine-protein kinase [Gemmatimonadales bacterium]|nr:serine/threonine-protein kinase [Gemmatimonadales bacterium]